MKRTVVGITLMLSVGGIVTPSSAAPASLQTVEGSVATSTRFPTDAFYTTWPKTQRDVWRDTGQNGVVGYTFPVAEATRGGTFTLTVTSGVTGAEDLDITWYEEYGSASPAGQAAVSPGGSTVRRPGGEAGVIPSNARYGMVSMFFGANAEFTYNGFAPVAPRTALKKAPPLPKPGIHPAFGTKRSAFSDALKKKSHVVIAIVDTGINPYHRAYKRPDLVAHPSTYIEGFPKNAPALGLTFGKDYKKAREADKKKVWSKADFFKLYWIPGTNIIGAYSTTPPLPPEPVVGDPKAPRTVDPIIDDNGHGTMTSSVAAGAVYGSNPDALIVMVQGYDKGFEWAAKQPWIDMISSSWGDPAAVPYNKNIPRIGQPETPEPFVNETVGDRDSRTYESSGPFVLRDGRTACFSAGNGATRTGAAYDRYSSIRPTGGPSWVVTVGAASPRNDQDYGWHSIPVDIASYGLHVPAAASDSVDGEQEGTGTSSATPIACGVFSKALLEARRAMGDTREGIHTARGVRVPAAGRRGPGMLADGVLTRLELQEAVFKTAIRAPLDPTTYAYEPVPSVPDTPLYYTQMGYGVVNRISAKSAVDVMLGRAPMPDRSDVDAWIAQLDTIRDAIWNPADYD